jgi:hypothetical protein
VSFTEKGRLSRRNPSGCAGRGILTHLDRPHLIFRLNPSFVFSVPNNRRGCRGGSLFHNVASFCARILDDPEIRECWSCERSNDNDTCQKLRFHRFFRPKKVPGHRRRKQTNLLIYCGAVTCNHSIEMNADYLPDDLPIRSLDRRMVCERCGHRDANGRPDWRPDDQQAVRLKPPSAGTSHAKPNSVAASSVFKGYESQTPNQDK